MNGLLYRTLINMPYFAWHDPTYPFVIPTINWEVMSHEQRIEWLVCNLKGLIKYVNEQADNLNLLDSDLDKLANEFEKFKESGFNDYYEKQIAQWIDEHLSYIYKHTIKQIYFAMSDEGFLLGFIPESWSDVSFWTPLDYDNQETYGHLQILLNNVVPYVEMED